MSVRARWIAVGGVIVVVLVKLGLVAWQLGSEQLAKLDALARPSFVAARVHKAQPFTPAEIATFLAQAKQATAIADPLQRCLAFPDPPGSHWSRETVDAYCHYTTQSVISAAEVTSLIQNDHADQVDRRFADALALQRTQPDSRGLLDRTFIMDFRDSSAGMRGILDAWKRQSPNSAFAYAASGTAYVIASHDARGDANSDQTEQTSFEAMNRVLDTSDSDFQKAVALNPKLTAAYAGMVEAGTYGSNDYGIKAASAGLAVDPSNFAIYVRLMQLSEPKWGGSIAQMEAVAAQAQKQVAKNPLLALLAVDAPAYKASGNDCDCYRGRYVPDYRSVFDRASGYRPMATAGEIAYRLGNSESGLALIYAAEALRFAPGESASRVTLAYELIRHGEPAWAVDEGNRLVQDKPGDSISYDVRGNAFETSKDYPHAMADYTKAFALDPTERWPLIQMATFNVYTTHDWANGWDEADQLIRAFPGSPEGWILRMSIQKDQPRAGLHDTMVYFLAHFSHNPNQQAAVREVTQALAAGK